MKFKDYEAKKAALDKDRYAVRPKLEAIQERESALAAEMRREWSLGSARFRDTGGPSGDVVEVRVVPSMGEAWTEVRLVGVHYDRGLQAYETLALSPAQWRMVADVVATIDRWRDGEIDELPPSGVWPGAEGAS